MARKRPNLTTRSSCRWGAKRQYVSKHVRDAKCKKRGSYGSACKRGRVPVNVTAYCRRPPR